MEKSTIHPATKSHAVPASVAELAVAELAVAELAVAELVEASKHLVTSLMARPFDRLRDLTVKES